MGIRYNPFGGGLVPGGSKATPPAIDALEGVDTTTTPPAAGQALVWNGSAWVPGDVATAALTAESSLDDLADVAVAAQQGASDGRALIYANGQWQAGPVIGGYSYQTGVDPLSEYTVFVLPFNSGFLDESGSFNQTTKTLIATTYNSPTITTAEKKFGAGSLNLSSGSPYIKYASTTHPDLIRIGASDFCVEGWFKDVKGWTHRPLFYAAANVYLTTANTLQGSLGGVNYVANQGWPGGWVHVALTRNAGVHRLFQNGVVVASWGASGANADLANAQILIGEAFPAGTYRWTGYIDDVRFTLGHARYTANFTPPTGALLGETVSLGYGINNLADVDTVSSAPAAGQLLGWNGSAWAPRTGLAPATLSHTAAALADGAAADFTLSAGQTYQLLALTASVPCWLRVYGTEAARTADPRTEPGPPLPAEGSDYYAEVVTDSPAQTLRLGPVPTVQAPSGVSYLRVVNQSGSSADVALSFKVLTLEE